MATMLLKQFTDVVLVVHSNDTPSDPEWADYLALATQFAKDGTLNQTKYLIWTDGGGPSSVQRREMNDILKGKGPQTAVVTGSRIVRGICTAISWFHPKIKPFAPSQLEAAFDHLKVPEHRRSKLETKLGDLRVELRSSRS